MWDSASTRLKKKGHEIIFNSKVEKIIKLENSGYEVVTQDGSVYSCDAVFSSMPLAHLPDTLDPKPSKNIIEAGKNLKFRDFLTVALVVDKSLHFPITGFIYMSHMFVLVVFKIMEVGLHI